MIPIHTLSIVDFEIMKKDIEVCKSLNANGVVFGILTPEGDLDIERMKELVALSRPMKVTLHRAFDMTRDPYKSLEDAITIGVDIILTSGQESRYVLYKS